MVRDRVATPWVRRALVAITVAALVPAAGVVADAHATDAAPDASAEHAAVTAFAEAGLAADPPGAVPVVIVTEAHDGRRHVMVQQADDTAAATADVADAMRRGRVVSVSVDRPVLADANIDGNEQWQYDPNQLSVQQAWNTSTGSGVTVAVIDTGVMASHVELNGQVLPGYDAVDGSTVDGRSDPNGHGTHVAGIIAAKRNAMGVVGVAPAAKILPVRALGSDGKGTSSSVTAGIYWAVDNGADVINMSLGTSVDDSAIAAAVAYAAAHDVLLVASAGNSGAGTVNYPAAYASALAVCATDSTRSRWASSSYSTTTPYVDVCAPGVGILSSYNASTTSLAYMDGTSMAAPHVAALAALLLAVHPALTATQLTSVIEATADDIDSPGTDAATGAGIIDPAAALAAAATLTASTTTSTTTTTTIASSTTTSTTSSTTSTVAPTTTSTTTTTVPVPALPTGASRYVPVTPTRLVDTRATGAVAPGATRTFAVTGRAGVPSDSTAVVLNVTVADVSGPGYVQVLPTGRASIGDSSNLNVAAAGATTANLVTVPVGDGGQVSVYVQGGGQLIVDLFGWFVPSGPATAGRYVALRPTRVLDTRDGLGVVARVPGPHGTTQVRLAGAAGVPATGVGAVVLNLTATEADPGFVQAMPTGLVAPGAYSNLNVTPDRPTVAGLAIVPLGADGTITVYTESAAQLAIDVLGYLTGDGAASATSGLFVPLRPARLLDTRRSVHADGVMSTVVLVRGAAGVPTSGASAVFGNLTMVGTGGPGFLQAYPTGDGTPGASSNVNATAAQQTIPNAVAATLSGDGRVTLYDQAGGDVLFDVAGWFTG